MGERIVCPKCGNNVFTIYKNPYVSEVIRENHIEIVCPKCPYAGIILGEIDTLVNILNKEDEKDANTS